MDKQFHSKSEQRRVEIQRGGEAGTAAEKPGKMVKLEALQNTQLPDTTFVEMGSVIEVTEDFAQRALAEVPVHFKKV